MGTLINPENKDKMASNDFCLKDVAVRHLREREKCALKADKYVDYVFEKCKDDKSPFSGSGTGGLRRNVTNII